MRLTKSLTIAGLLLRGSRAECDFEPLELPLTDVQILPSVKDSLVRGIPATVGSPAQKIVLLPWSYVHLGTLETIA